MKRSELKAGMLSILANEHKRPKWKCESCGNYCTRRVGKHVLCARCSPKEAKRGA